MRHLPEKHSIIDEAQGRKLILADVPVAGLTFLGRTSAMTEETFLDLISQLERELLTEGLTLEQIEKCETAALAITAGDFYAGPVEYICTINRLANSGLY